MLLSKVDLLSEEKLGNLCLSERLEYSAFSCNIRLGTLYRIVRQCAPHLFGPDGREIEISQEQYIDEYLEEISIPEEGIVLNENDRYMCQTLEKVFLAPGLGATSRSSWARLGVHIKSKPIDDTLHISQIKYNDYPLCSLRTTGTRVLIKKGDEIGQIFVYEYPSFLIYYETAKLISDGKFEIHKDGKKLSLDKIIFHGEMVLTMDPKIKIYKGKVLIPGNLKEDDFSEETLVADKPLYLKQGTFFISSSAESVYIPPEYAGFVTERSSIMTLQMYTVTKRPEFAPSPMFTHANAPYIGPKTVFSGKITFENHMGWGDYIKCGMKQTELVLMRFRTPIIGEEKSRYDKQSEPTTSQLEENKD